MKEWYPLAGSQRLRAVAEIKKTNPDFNCVVDSPQIFRGLVQLFLSLA